MSAKMEKYGNEPTAAEKFTEEFIHRLSVFNGLSFSKLKLLPSLKILKLYYPLMSQLFMSFERDTQFEQSSSEVSSMLESGVLNLN